MEDKGEHIEKTMSRAERWTNEQKVLRAKQEGHQIMQAALDSGLINKDFSVGELHAKIPHIEALRSWYILFGSDFFFVINDDGWIKAPSNPCDQQVDLEYQQSHLAPK